MTVCNECHGDIGGCTCEENKVIEQQAEQIATLDAENSRLTKMALDEQEKNDDLLDERNHLAESLVQANLDIIRQTKIIDHLQNQLLEEKE